MFIYIVQDDTRKIEIENIKLKNELKHYKEMYHNVEMLREEKYSLETRVQEMEQLKSDNLKLDLENTRLKQERMEWYIHRSTTAIIIKNKIVINAHKKGLYKLIVFFLFKKMIHNIIGLDILKVMMV